MVHNRSIQDSTVIPVLVDPDVLYAAKWLRDTFGFTQRVRIGTHRVQMAIGTGAIPLTEPRPAESLGEGALPLRPPPGDALHSAITVRVDDVDRHVEHARAAGARILSSPSTQPYGECQYAVADFAGHRWVFSQSVRDVAPEEWGGEWVTDPT
jgi:uncharacterized glyoxalase superfamily protein PhnB